MNTTLSIPKVPEIITDRFYSIQADAAVNATYIMLDRKLENNFEVVTINNNPYLLTGAVKTINDVKHYEIYPSLLSALVVGDRLSCVQYNSDKNQGILSTAQNFDIYSKFFKLIGELKTLTDKLSSTSLQLPLDNYQIAVKYGFTGTEAEWLLSLKGKDGITVDTSVFVLKTVYNNTINNIENRLRNLENTVSDQPTPTYGNLSASDNPLVIIWNTDLVPDDPSQRTYEEKHGLLRNTSVQVLMQDAGMPDNLIEYPNSWSIDAATQNILTIDNQSQNALYTIGFGSNGISTGGGGGDTDEIITRVFIIQPSEIEDGMVSLVGKTNTKGDQIIPADATITIYEGGSTGAMRYNEYTNVIDNISGSQVVKIVLRGIILPIELP